MSHRAYRPTKQAFSLTSKKYVPATHASLYLSNKHFQAYIIGAEVPVDDPEAGTFSTGPNMWPKALPDEQFRGPIMDYQSKMIELVKVLLRILSLGLPKEWGCPDDALCPLAYGRPSIPMRLIHYAPQEVLDERQFGGECLRKGTGR